MHLASAGSAGFAIHRLLIAQERKLNSPKRAKDLKQAKDLIDVFVEADPAGFEDALDEARNRAPSGNET